MKTIQIDDLPGCRPYLNERSIRVRQSQSGMRLIDFLLEYHPPTPRQQWLDWIEAGDITLDSQTLSIDHRMRIGGRYVHAMRDFVEPRVNATIRIIADDESLLVVDKPAPLPVHPSGRFNRNTLTKLLEGAYPNVKLRIAHRLDANTTGVVVFTKSSEAAAIVQPQFEQRRVKKTYLVRVHGHVPWESHHCDLPIGHARSAGPTTDAGTGGARTIDKQGSPAETHFQCLQRNDDGTSLLTAIPVTGRTNQIRVHAAAIGHAVLGDPFYPRQTTAENDQSAIIQTLDIDQPPMCLHAWRLKFKHPQTEQETAYESPPPPWAQPTTFAP
ncbi:RluA family pseudouridine synthase [Rhodopirellula sallentina]|uniref:Pseudouridine synthase n=1 Tax=Rhodopirellula sallentina SM41 TaxID=1263870 RepID=M5TTM4_9BACT|nr:RluA family pseudouridine synthase [Rhodopirellula sallentina]EMI52542.1 pseudouridine synthase, RluA family [Rhodopirellula sallentina SM41]